MLAVASGGRLAAQGTPESTAEYRQVVDRLAERWRRLVQAESLPQIGSGSEGLPRFDTVRLGTLTLLAPPPRAELAHAVARAAWDSITRDFGSDTVVLLPQTVTIGFGRGSRRVASPEYQEASVLASVLAAVRSAEATRLRPDSAVADWFSSSLLAMLFASDSVQRSVTHMELATKPWAVVRACYDGDLDACRRALAIATTPDSVAFRFTPAERRHLVEQAMQNWRERPPGMARCIDAAVDSACIDLFRRFPQYLNQEPLSAVARATLLRTAVALGGAGWYARLLSTSGPDYLARLSIVAGTPPETLLAEWRARIMSAKLQRMTLSRLSGWVAFLWAAIFAVAATRSSRWRRD